jgi:hypothetical protein
MADTLTPNIGALVADPNDPVNYTAHIGNNWTLFDSLMGLVKCTSITRPSNTYGGQGIFETDTGRVAVNTNTKASPTWTYVTSTIFSATSTTRPTLGLVNGLLNLHRGRLAVRHHRGLHQQHPADRHPLLRREDLRDRHRP